MRRRRQLTVVASQSTLQVQGCPAGFHVCPDTFRGINGSVSCAKYLRGLQPHPRAVAISGSPAIIRIPHTFRIKPASHDHTGNDATSHGFRPMPFNLFEHHGSSTEFKN
jgi:hypothetical protein